MAAMDRADLDFVAEALHLRPRALLLGQEYLSGPTDDFLSVAFRTLDPQVSSAYDWWLRGKGDIGERASTFVRAEKSVLVPDDLRLCLRQPWTTVFTSAIDSLARSLFEIPERRHVIQMTAPGLPRKGADLPLFRLFGTVDRATVDELPPADADSLRRRRTAARAMLQAVGPAVSVRGRLFVEGWNPALDHDWLRPRDLATALSTLDEDQVLIFGIDDAKQRVLEADEDIAQLLQLRVLRLYSPRLAEFVAAIHAQGVAITDDDWTTRPDDTVPYQLAARAPLLEDQGRPELKTILIGTHDWRRLSAGLRILEDPDQTRPLPAVADEQRQLFRSFSATGAEPRLWPWLPHLAFRRPALDAAVRTCLRLCRLPTPQSYPTLTPGQVQCADTLVSRGVSQGSARCTKSSETYRDRPS
jgi:hypothetical protein